MPIQLERLTDGDAQAIVPAEHVWRKHTKANPPTSRCEHLDS